MRREFKTKEEAINLFRHFYNDAFDDKNTEIAILNPKDDGIWEQKLKVKKYGEPYWRVYFWKEEANNKNVYFYLETLDGKTISDQYGADNIRNYFSVFNNYEE